MAMHAWRRWEAGTTRSRRRSTGSCLVALLLAHTTWTPSLGASSPASSGTATSAKRRLGDKYSAVQKRVNEILGASGTSSTSMDVDAMARAVIRGDYGNGEERKRRLGSYYCIVQRRVSEMLS